jgi:opacity protein-like surface antigen
MSVSHIAECPDLGPECFNGGPAPVPYNHHVDQVIAESSFNASLGITSWFGVETRWSMRIADVNPTYSELDATPKQVPNDIHHQDETLVDITDPWLIARFAATQGDLVSMLRLGASFPLGRTEPNPYALGMDGERHQHLQAGTGTVVPIVGVGFSYAIARDTSTPVVVGLGGVGFFNAYENAEGFRAPTRLYGSHRVSVSFLEGQWNPFAEITIAHETEEYWDGKVGLEGSNIRTELYVGGGLEWRFIENWSVDITARARVASLTDAPTFKSYGLFSMGISAAFDLWDTDDEPKSSKPDQNKQQIEERHRGGVTEFEKN